MIFIMLLCGCQGDSGALLGSTFEDGQVNELSQSQDISLSVSASDLLNDPDAFVGDQLQMSGDLSRSLRMKCNLKARHLPATWTLSDGVDDIPVASSSQQLNQLSTGIKDIILAGRWTYWKGLVGCGRDTSVEEQWYLDVDRIISPNPIALVPVLTASPFREIVDSGEQPAFLGTATPDSSPSSQSISGDEGQLSVPASSTPQDTVTQSPSSVTATIEESEATRTPTQDQNQGPITPAATSDQSSPVPQSSGTPAASPVAPTLTATIESSPESTTAPSPIQTVFQMALDISSIETGRLGEYEVHKWTHEITSTKQLTVSLASENQLDLAVSIVDETGHIVAQQNTAFDGEPEIIRGVTLLDPGIYDILVSSPLGEEGYYAILISDNESYPYIFQGTLTIDQDRYAQITPNSDHFWHFSGSAGQVVTIRVVPTDDSDLFLNLFGVDGVSLIRFHDETAAGEPEQIAGYVLPDTGIYSLRIGEFNFGAASYEIILTDN